ncbi:MAG: tetratricopeptide repeat protein [Thermoanaerobaculales bacterium]
MSHRACPGTRRAWEQSRDFGTLSELSRRAHRLPAAIAVVAGLSAVAVLAGCGSTTAVGPPPHLGFPSPDSGPGGPTLDRSDQRQIERGWTALETGDTAAARLSAGRAGENPAAQLLELQATVSAKDGDPLVGLEELTTTQPEYAAAWLTLSVAAEQAGHESVALEAARFGAKLWPDQRWIARASDLHRRWVEDRTVAAQRLLDAGDAPGAIEAVEPALALVPADRGAVLVKARALLAQGETDEAEIVLLALQGDPDALLLEGGIAESRRDWQTAMDLYTALPADHPERQDAVRRARIRWRLSMMPPFVHEAMVSEELDRAGLAVVLVATAPQIETIEGGRVPVLSDIVDLPSQREIINAVRLEMLSADALDHRFYPNRKVTAEEVQSAIDTLCNLLGMAPLRWCSGESTEPCADLEEPIDGGTVTDLVLGVVEKAGG